MRCKNCDSRNENKNYNNIPNKGILFGNINILLKIIIL